jgi:Na+/proline symporter
MSDIDMLNALLTVIGIALLLGSPGLMLGAIAGALLWRGHRVAGAVLGAVAGLVLWLAGWIALI